MLPETDGIVICEPTEDVFKEILNLKQSFVGSKLKAESNQVWLVL